MQSCCSCCNPRVQMSSLKECVLLGCYVGAKAKSPAKNTKPTTASFSLWETKDTMFPPMAGRQCNRLRKKKKSSPALMAELFLWITYLIWDLPTTAIPSGRHSHLDLWDREKVAAVDVTVTVSSYKYLLTDFKLKGQASVKKTQRYLKMYPSWCHVIIIGLVLWGQFIKDWYTSSTLI